MSKKHFTALADALRNTKPGSADADAIGINTAMQREAKLQQWLKDLDAICAFCRSQNARFDEGRFRGYILGLNGPNGGKVAK